MELGGSYVNKIMAFNLEWGKRKPNAEGGEEDVVNKEERRLFVIKNFGYVTSSVIRFKWKALNKMSLFRASYLKFLKKMLEYLLIRIKGLGILNLIYNLEVIV